MRVCGYGVRKLPLSKLSGLCLSGGGEHFCGQSRKERESERERKGKEREIYIIICISEYASCDADDSNNVN